MSQLDAVEMRDFLDSINECCDEFSHSWSTNNLDISALKEIKAKLNNLALENKGKILSFYDYASGKGRYVIVTFRPLLDIMCKYEEYHDDLMEFIKSILSERKLLDDKDGSAIRHVEEAARTDERFRESLFTETEKVVFPDTIENLQTFMGLNAFIDKVYDNFIYLSRKDDITSPKVKILIDLYATSVIAFLRKMIQESMQYVTYIDDVMNGRVKPIVEEKQKPYKLI